MAGADGGNVKWRITDPRGFDLEISSENFASVLACTTMVNGVIQGKCVWGRLGKDNVLLPESSEPYIEASKLTAKVNANLTVKDMTTGDIVELLNQNMSSQYEYLGGFKIHCVKSKENDHYTREYQVLGAVKDRYIFRDVNTDKYVAVSTPKVGAIVTKSAAPLDKVKTAEDITRKCQGDIDTIYETVVLVSTTKVTAKQASFLLVDSDYVFDTTFPKRGKYEWSNDVELFVYEMDGNCWISQSRYDYSGSKNNSKLVAVDKARLLQGEVYLVGTVTVDNSYWRRTERFESSVLVPESTMKFKKLVMTVGDVSYNVDKLI